MIRGAESITNVLRVRRQKSRIRLSWFDNEWGYRELTIANASAEFAKYVACVKSKSWKTSQFQLESIFFFPWITPKKGSMIVVLKNMPWESLGTGLRQAKIHLANCWQVALCKVWNRPVIHVTQRVNSVTPHLPAASSAWVAEFILKGLWKYAWTI